jgi:EAL domain-containing protein (putative c-di-GMP-specific phosphodiesterase class I)
MVRSINEIGHLTGKLTIAEFAENAEIIEMLRNLGVDFAQGYGIAQPQRVYKTGEGPT